MTATSPSASIPASSAPAGYKPLQIGDVAIGFPVVQAALSGYSDGPMRRIARRLGAPYTLCEVLLDEFVITAGKGTRKMMKVAEEEHPVAGQLMGALPENFPPAALRLIKEGFDVVDINFGCPVKKVLGRCRGGFHLSQPTVALEIVKRVRDALPPKIPVTVKMRRGIDDTDEARDKFFEIFEGAFALGAAAITVHGRTVKQRYIGPSNWNFLREVKRLAGDRVILGSGDLFTAQACLDMIEQTGVDGVTAARGAIGNPWIFREARALAAGQPLPDPPSLFEQREVILEHYRLAEELWGADRCGRMMRKFGIKYAQLHPEPLLVRDAFIRVKNLAEWQAVLTEHYSTDLPGRRPPAADDIGECGCD
ncbi:MAG TPA: tRNA-dihydrouridine synthase [Pirellulales bacterium]